MSAEHLEAATARRAIERALGESCQELGRLGAGRSSSVWASTTASGRWVVRVPAATPRRTMSYRSESKVCALLHRLGHPVATWTVVEVDGLACSVGDRLDGRPVDYGERFTPAFASGLGRLLSDLHHLEAERFGPLVDDDSHLCGTADTLGSGIVQRWHVARIWPFDDPDLSSHPVAWIAPDLVDRLVRLRDSIVDASGGPIGPVHSDLHREHLLRDELGSLAGVLDFGDTFIGPTAWDSGLLHWYYGRESAGAVAAHHDDVDEFDGRGRYLSVAVGLYKLAKDPSDQSMPDRLRLVLDGLG